MSDLFVRTRWHGENDIVIELQDMLVGLVFFLIGRISTGRMLFYIGSDEKKYDNADISILLRRK